MNISFPNFGAVVAFDPLDRLESVPFLPGRTLMCLMAAINLINTDFSTCLATQESLSSGRERVQ